MSLRPRRRLADTLRGRPPRDRATRDLSRCSRLRPAVIPVAIPEPPAPRRRRPRAREDSAGVRLPMATAPDPHAKAAFAGGREPRARVPAKTVIFQTFERIRKKSPLFGFFTPLTPKIACNLRRSSGGRLQSSQNINDLAFRILPRFGRLHTRV